MKFKQLLSALLIAAMLTSNAFAFSDFLPRDDISSESKDTETSAEAGTEASDSQSGNPSSPSYSMIPRDEYYYNMFLEILNLYVKEHLYETSNDEVISKMIKTILKENPQYFEFFVSNMLSTMDPYSSYHEASSYFLNVENAAKGYGITCSESDGKIFITGTLANSNALAAGLMAGDRIVSVAGYSVDGLPYNAAQFLLRYPYVFASQKGEDGKYADFNPPIDIVVERNGEMKTFNLIRGEMTTDQISSSVLDDGKTAYVAISSFLGTDMDKEFSELLYGFAASGIKNLTIDLRDNGGGSLEYALAMAEVFFPQDELLCYYNDKKLEEPTPVYSTTPEVKFDSISILVNGNTASAAELMTSILKTSGKAKVVGSQTYGKAVGQTVYYLPNGDYITITTYEMLDINKENYNGVGIVPDIEIEDVLLMYTLPSLHEFNYENYVDIKEGVYSEPALALEERLSVMGMLYAEDADGICDEKTSAALRILQRMYNLSETGNVTLETVNKITDIINGYKTGSDYYDDTQFDVANMVHRSFSQAKRLASEKETLREKNARLIEERDKKILDDLDKAEK